MMWSNDLLCIIQHLCCHFPTIHNNNNELKLHKKKRFHCLFVDVCLMPPLKIQKRTSHLRIQIRPRKKIPQFADGKSSKSLINFENKQPNCTILFSFVFGLSFIGCNLSKTVGFDQLWTDQQQKLVTTNRKLVYFKMPNTFCRFAVQNCRYFLPCKLPWKE